MPTLFDPKIFDFAILDDEAQSFEGVSSKMTGTDVIARARSLADLPNAQFVSYQDQLQSLNESYKDIYEWLLQNNDDYYVTEVLITLTASNLSPTDIGSHEYLATLPSDFKSIRYLDVSQNNRWVEVQKFPVSSRNIDPSSPMYRIRGNYLFVMGGMSGGVGATYRLGYYPVNAQITLPGQDYVYGTSYSPGSFPNITYPAWAPPFKTVAYVYGGTRIYAESQDNGTVASPVALSATLPASASFLNYYKGYLYWIESGDLVRAAATLTSGTLTTATLTSIGSVTSCSVFGDAIYFTDNNNVKSCTLVGGSIATIAVATAATYPTKLGTDTFYVKANGVYGVAAGQLAASGYTAVTSDGTYLYALDTAKSLHRWATDTATFAVATDSIVREDVTAIGTCMTAPQRQISTVVPWFERRMPIITGEHQEMLSISAEVDYSFSYPNNIVPEIMAHRCAIDWKIKQNADPTGLMQRLGNRDQTQGPITGLWLRLYQSLQRDEYSPDRINNRYQQPWGIW